jgi:SAM-dependent methyltransferase
MRVLREALKRCGIEIARITSEEDDLAVYRRLYPAELLARRPFFNVGAGTFRHPYWTNLDYVSEWYRKAQGHVIHFDLMACGELPVDQAEVIYTSHTIEHVTECAVAKFFSEAHRVLKPEGVFRITTGPDADLDYSALMRGDVDWFYWDDYYARNHAAYSHIFHLPANTMPLAERWLHHVASPLVPNDRSPSDVKFAAEQIMRILSERSMESALDYFTGLCRFDPARPGNHISWWNKAKVIRFLRVAGFTEVNVSGYGQSSAAVMRNTAHFDNTHPAMSLYVEAVKS